MTTTTTTTTTGYNRETVCAHIAADPEIPVTARCPVATGWEGMCEACANEYERKLFHATPVGAKFTGYITGSDPRHLTTWTGAALAVVSYTERTRTFHPSIGRCVRETVHISYLTPAGIRRWYGFRFTDHPLAGDVITLKRVQ